MPDNSEIFRRVAQAVDIVDVVAEHVVLKRAGREYKGLCPFHDDHRPSMAVVPHKQIFHCFVCGMGGDVFKFVQNFHKMTPGESLRFLAQKAGIQLPELPRSGRGAAGNGSNGERSLRERIAETNQKATTFFEKTLRTDAGRPGLDYLHDRGLTDDTIALFRLGMSPDKWTGLTDAAAKANIPIDLLFSAGLIKKRGDGSPYDAFRNRVIFPIIDGTGAGGGGGEGGGRVIAFGGRVLAEKRDEEGNVVEAKYLNSPETDLFKKSEALYGINFAKPHIIKSETAVIVEGYMDVIACHQAGIKNVVATLGTALTPEHARQLRRFCHTVVLIFDSDDAGFRAADRALETFVKEPLDIKLAAVPDGKDPCDFCIARGDQAGPAFQQVIDTAVDALTYQWRRLQKQFSASDSLSARQTATTQFIRFVAQAMEASGGNAAGVGAGSGVGMDILRRQLLVSKISALLNLPVPEVNAELRKSAAATHRTENRAAPSFNAAPVNPSDAPTRNLNIQNLNGSALAEAWVLGSLLCDPQLYDKVREDLSLELFAPANFRNLAEKIFEYMENSPTLADCSLAHFLSDLGDPTLIDEAIRLQSQTESSGNHEKMLPDALKFLRAAATPETDPSQEQSIEARLQNAIEEKRRRQAEGGDLRKSGVQPGY